MPKRPLKVFVFDLDETLGHFVEFGMFCDALDNYFNDKVSDKHFDEYIRFIP